MTTSNARVCLVAGRSRSLGTIERGDANSQSILTARQRSARRSDCVAANGFLLMISIVVWNPLAPEETPGVTMVFASGLVVGT